MKKDRTFAVRSWGFLGFRRLFFDGFGVGVYDFVVAAFVAIVAIAILAAFVAAADQHAELIAEDVAQKGHNADESDDPEDHAKDGSGLFTHKTTRLSLKWIWLIDFILLL